MTGPGNNGSPSEIRVLLMPSSNTSTAQSVGREGDGEGEYRTEGVRWGGGGGGVVGGSLQKQHLHFRRSITRSSSDGLWRVPSIDLVNRKKDHEDRHQI